MTKLSEILETGVLVAEEIGYMHVTRKTIVDAMDNVISESTVQYYAGKRIGKLRDQIVNEAVLSNNLIVMSQAWIMGDLQLSELSDTSRESLKMYITDRLRE